mmetsp:Transcript_13041/g.38849  ORF Transcript_13041/g.38849 Transcript_13041/m.38849 type:complete len:288 (+) Transcript_13041:1002-1865(+)
MRIATLLLPQLARRARRCWPRRAHSVYDRPELYDAAFGFRDFEAEVDFLLAAHEAHAGRPARRVLELAAGPARHAVEAATRGLECKALDSSAAMVAYGSALARAASVSLDYREGDARDARACAALACDAAWLLLGSLGHFLTADDAVAVLRAAAAAVAPGGTFVIEVPHPRETFRLDDVGMEAWVADLPDGSGEVAVRWGADDDAFDALTQVRAATVAFDVRRQGGTETLEEVVPTREFTLQELLLLARLSGGFEPAATYGALDLDVAADDLELAYRLIVVLRRKHG